MNINEVILLDINKLIPDICPKYFFGFRTIKGKEIYLIKNFKIHKNDILEINHIIEPNEDENDNSFLNARYTIIDNGLILYIPCNGKEKTIEIENLSI